MHEVIGRRVYGVGPGDADGEPPTERLRPHRVRKSIRIVGVECIGIVGINIWRRIRIEVRRRMRPGDGFGGTHAAIRETTFRVRVVRCQSTIRERETRMW